MPIIDMTAIRCQWCHTDRGVFACHVCNKPTCRECIKTATEGTCEHEPYTAPTVQGWTAARNSVEGRQHDRLYLNAWDLNDNEGHW